MFIYIYIYTRNIQIYILAIPKVNCEWIKNVKLNESKNRINECLFSFLNFIAKHFKYLQIPLFAKIGTITVWFYSHKSTMKVLHSTMKVLEKYHESTTNVIKGLQGPESTIEYYKSTIEY